MCYSPSCHFVKGFLGLHEGRKSSCHFVKGFLGLHEGRKSSCHFVKGFCCCTKFHEEGTKPHEGKRIMEKEKHLRDSSRKHFVSLRERLLF